MPVICCPPVTVVSPELGADSDAVLRRTRFPRRYEFRALACSGEANPNRSWRIPPVSALLTGVGFFGMRLPPVTEAQPELGADSYSVLRRTVSRRRYEFCALASSGETNPNRSWCFPPVSALLTGVGFFGMRLPPVTEAQPELGTDSYSVLRRTESRRRYGFRALACSGEANP